MGDKSPKSKQRNRNQMAASKLAKAAKAKVKKDGQTGRGAEQEAKVKKEGQAEQPANASQRK